MYSRMISTMNISAVIIQEYMSIKDKPTFGRTNTFIAITIGVAKTMAEKK